MQVIEKVKVVPEGYNGGGMLGDGSTNINVLGATAGSGSGANLCSLFYLSKF